MKRFSQVDVFSSVPYSGNPLAVVHDGDGLSEEEMARFANWTNLSETTFLCEPTNDAADYRVRIFTPYTELPFAGHPTIGSCHAWLEAGGQPAGETIIQECAAGLIELRREQGRLAFAAPPLLRSGDVAAKDLTEVCRILQIQSNQIVDSQWVDNGPGWLGVLLGSREEVLDLEVDFSASDSFDIGVAGIGKVGVAATDPMGRVGLEVRAFFRQGMTSAEDPVTGSLNASLAQWLIGSGRIAAPYVARQGSAIGRDGRVFVDEADNRIWVGGDSVTCISGNVDL